MITFIEQSDINDAAIDACTKITNDADYYLRAGRGRDASDLNNLMAGTILNTRNTFLLSLLEKGLISGDCYSFCKKIEADKQ